VGIATKRGCRDDEHDNGEVEGPETHVGIATLLGGSSRPGLFPRSKGLKPAWGLRLTHPRLPRQHERQSKGLKPAWGLRQPGLHSRRQHSLVEGPETRVGIATGSSARFRAPGS